MWFRPGLEIVPFDSAMTEIYEGVIIYLATGVFLTDFIDLGRRTALLLVRRSRPDDLGGAIMNNLSNERWFPYYTRCIKVGNG